MVFATSDYDGNPAKPNDLFFNIGSFKMDMCRKTTFCANFSLPQDW